VCLLFTDSFNCVNGQGGAMEAQAIKKARKLALFHKRLTFYAKCFGLAAAIVTAGATVAGGMFSGWQFLMSQIEQRKAAELKQLSTFGTFAQLVTTSRAIEKKTVLFVQKLDSEGGFSPDRLNALLQAHKSGAAIYTSDEFKDFREIHEFYEELGLVVKEDSTDFDLVFELITFPSDFSYKTDNFCRFLGKNWFEKGTGIAGMCDDTRYLGKRYDAERKDKGVLNRYRLPPEDDLAPDKNAHRFLCDTRLKKLGVLIWCGEEDSNLHRVAPDRT
jgi:hypothetical protein